MSKLPNYSIEAIKIRMSAKVHSDLIQFIMKTNIKQFNEIKT
jgi:hypothetical protein